jgi:hypothetical protein
MLAQMAPPLGEVVVRMCPCAMRERVEGFFWRANAENQSFGSEVSWGTAMLSIEERCVAATVATGIVVVLVASWLLG